MLGDGGAILLALSDESLAYAIQRFLRRAGFRAADPVSNALTALDVVKNTSFGTVIVELGSDAAIDIADGCISRGSPVIFLAGMSRVPLPARLHTVPILTLPIDFDALLALVAILGPTR